MKKKFFCLLFFLLLFSSSVSAASTITIQDLPSHSAAPASSDLFILYDTSESVTSKITAAFLLSILDGANITADSITDAAINFSSLTLDDFTFDVGSVDKTEFGYVNGVTSSIQDQLNTKAAKGANTDITSLTGMTTPLGAAYGGSGVANNALSTWTISGNYPTTITVTGITSVTMPTTGTLLTTTGSGAGLTALNGENISNNTIDDDSLNFTDITLNDFTFDVGDVDKTEFSYIDGGTSNFQDQIDGKLSTTGSASGLSGYSLGAQPLHANLTYLSLGINPLSGSPWPAAPTGTNLVQGFPYWANGLDWDPLSRQKTTGAIATIAFVEGGASADTITDSDNGFVTAGIAEHMRIKVSGSGSNDGYYTIDTVTAGTITLVTTDDLVDEAAGATITILAGYRYEVLNDQGTWVGLRDEHGNLFAASLDMSLGYIKAPHGASVTVDEAGKFGIDETSGQFVYFDDEAKRVLVYDGQIDFVFKSPVDADDTLICKLPRSITLLATHVIVDPADSGESISVDVQECDATGDNCATVDAALTADNDGAVSDGTYSNGALDANDWIKVVLGAPTGTISNLTGSIFYVYTAD